MKTVAMWKNACGVLSEKEPSTKSYLNYYCNYVKMNSEGLEKNME